MMLHKRPLRAISQLGVQRVGAGFRDSINWQLEAGIYLSDTGLITTINESWLLVQSRPSHQLFRIVITQNFVPRTMSR